MDWLVKVVAVFASLILSLLPVLLVIVLDVILDILVLVEEEPEHSIKFFGGLDLNLLMWLHICQFFLHVLDASNFMIWKLTLISHQVVIGTDKVLLQLVVESLSGDLHADSKHYLNVHHVLFQCSIQDPQMSFTWLFDWVFRLVLCGHDLIQMDFIVQEIVKLKSLKRLKHLLYVLLQCLY